MRPLRPRQREVASLLQRGASVAEIAGRLGVTVNVAATYVASVRRHEKVRAAAARGERVELTPREAQVAALLEEGATNREIARRLGIGARTVDSHVASVMLKQGGSSRAQVVRDRVPNTGLGALSLRELEVLHLIARGLSQSQVAKRLNIGERTVKSHAIAIRKKLRVPGHKSLARFGMDARVD